MSVSDKNDSSVLNEWKQGGQKKVIQMINRTGVSGNKTTQILRILRLNGYFSYY